MVERLYKQKLNHATSIATLQAQSVAETSENLPIRDLSDLYADRQSAELLSDIETAKEKSHVFELAWKGNLLPESRKAGGGDLARSIVEYEELEELMGRIMSYAGLLYADAIKSIDPEEVESRQ